jgi:hypothetical protein
VDSTSGHGNPESPASRAAAQAGSIPTGRGSLPQAVAVPRPGNTTPDLSDWPDCTRSYQHPRASLKSAAPGRPQPRPSDTMSNATQHSRQPGDNRRRRSRGGKNRRNNNQNENRRDGERDTRERRGGPSNRSEEFRPQAPRPPRGRPPVKLTWWQKLLKAIGLYKEPAPPARRERKPDEAKPQGEPRAPKSNTRNARSGEAAVERSDERPDDEARPKRGRGGNRTGDRPRGGDPSTVESARVYVGNLSYDVTEQDLQELFKGVGGCATWKSFTTAAPIARRVTVCGNAPSRTTPCVPWRCLTTSTSWAAEADRFRCQIQRPGRARRSVSCCAFIRKWRFSHPHSRIERKRPPEPPAAVFCFTTQWPWRDRPQ